MPIDALLSIPQTDLLVQQSPPCLITLTNNGPGDAVVPTPVQSEAVLGMKVVDIKTGIEIARWREVGLLPPKPKTLKVGDTVTGPFEFLSVAHIHMPGEYDVSALIKIGTQLIESNVVRVKITPVTPRSPSLVSVNGGHAALKYSVSINRADPVRLVRHRIEADNDGGATNAWALAPVPPNVQPCISSCALNSVTHAHWIAWIDGDTLSAQHIAVDGSTTAVQSTKLPRAGASIVAPMSIDAGGVPAAPAAGRALTHTPGFAGGALQVWNLAANAKPEASDSRTLDGEAPIWLRSTERADRTRWVLHAAKIDGKPTLQTFPWPDGGKSGVAAQKIGTFDGDFLAGDAVHDDQGALHIALLVLADPKTARQVKVVTWRCAPDAPPVAGPTRDIPWPTDQPVVKAIIRLDQRNEPVALMSDGASWSVHDSVHGLLPAPDALKTASAVELVFFKAVAAYLIGKPLTGYEILQIDGQPLPHKCG